MLDGETEDCGRDPNWAAGAHPVPPGPWTMASGLSAAVCLINASTLELFGTELRHVQRYYHPRPLVMLLTDPIMRT